MAHDVNSFLDVLTPTEQRNPRTQEIDLADTAGILAQINNEDALVASAVEKALPQIAVVVDKISEAFGNGGRLLYFGAGTSGRLAVLDAAECPPTFGVSSDLVQAYIAGGDAALRNAVEGAEDSQELGIKDAGKAKIQKNDVVVGVSASGGAAYVIRALEKAREVGAFTACITSHSESALAKTVMQPVVVETGPEAVTGSTRMKAGTAQKMVLNMLTTAAMIQTGKTYGNFMVDVQPTNKKLKDRAERIVAALSGCNQATAAEALTKTNYQVKPAVVMIALNIDAQEARQRLAEVSGKLRRVLIES